MKIPCCLIIIYLFFLTELLFPFERYEYNCSEDLLLKSREILISQVGTLEKTKRNDGEIIDEYLKSVGLKKGNPYCAAGQFYCFFKGVEILGLDISEIPIKRTGLASEIFNHSRKFGKKTAFKPEIDDLIIWRKGKTPFGHIERIISVSKKGWVRTVGFNTSKIIGSKLYEGVFVKRRNIYHRLTGMTIRGLTGFRAIK